MDLNVSGVSTFVGVVTTSNDLFVGGGVSVVGVVTIANDIVLGGNLQTIVVLLYHLVVHLVTFKLELQMIIPLILRQAQVILIIDSAGGTIDINDNVDISGNLVCGGTGTFTGDLIAFSSSDENLKENLVVIPNALN